MNKIKIAALLIVSCLTLFALSACHSVSTVTKNPDGTFSTNVLNTLDTNRVNRVAKQAAIDGTEYVLEQHPTWAANFQLAANDLNQLAVSPAISLDDILAIAERLPVKELGSGPAKLSFEGATLAISLLDIPQIPSQANADLQTLAKAIADGINTGIEQAALAPPPVSPATPVPSS